MSHFGGGSVDPDEEFSIYNIEYMYIFYILYSMFHILCSSGI